MRAIAITNQKGGTGKTTTAVNVAAAVARYGHRVLLVDLDPQSHASLHVGVQPAEDEPSVYDVLVGGVAPDKALCKVSERLFLLPATIDLVGAELELGERDRREELLANALGSCGEGFDYCIIDCPPSLGLLTINALAAVEEVIIPLQPHFLALQGLGRLLETVKLVRQVLNPELRVSGIVLCMFEKGTRLAQEVLEDITQFVGKADSDDPWCGARVFDAKIRRNVKLAECPSFGQTVYDYAPSCHGAEDYLALTGEILGMGSAALVASGASEPVSKPIAEVVPVPELGPPGPAVADVRESVSREVPEAGQRGEASSPVVTDGLRQDGPEL